LQVSWAQGSNPDDWQLWFNQDVNSAGFVTRNLPDGPGPHVVTLAFRVGSPPVEVYRQTFGYAPTLDTEETLPPLPDYLAPEWLFPQDGRSWKYKAAISGGQPRIFALGVSPEALPIPGTVLSGSLPVSGWVNYNRLTGYETGGTVGGGSTGGGASGSWDERCRRARVVFELSAHEIEVEVHGGCTPGLSPGVDGPFFPSAGVSLSKRHGLKLHFSGLYWKAKKGRRPGFGFSFGDLQDDLTTAQAGM
jgi:hypothetical protein